MSSWIKPGQMKYHETIYEGIEKAADEFGLLDVSKFPKNSPESPSGGHGFCRGYLDMVEVTGSNPVVPTNIDDPVRNSRALPFY